MPQDTPLGYHRAGEVHRHAEGLRSHETRKTSFVPAQATVSVAELHACRIIGPVGRSRLEGVAGGWRWLGPPVGSEPSAVAATTRKNVRADSRMMELLWNGLS